ncbi:hypothetical protein CLV30_12720 [Haloactinopolyspora alba]|uniref:Spermatogenesis-associated protein 20-like TRX domain-containing protein n=1 Tax=Haloactinopolyspora alba TaxID=648780 RepID=A0A2P8DFT9_9ACTN|nr:thioredoxin domain-containing protein [Haloactinopolyspora alba]PSK96079.1 hypothetical protein CLV30_12720 [Haloactinopolyspora alba]
MANRLQDALSPYLRQHADNPVDWWPWGDDAFAEARRRDVPVLLSVGYAACHWCHVMAHESFESDEIAAYMNEHFVAVKVDREERPDVDAVYMESVQALTGQGGWPMTAFLTPDGRPFYAGTYYPPRPHPGMPSFPQVLQAVVQAWEQRRGEVTEAAGQIADSLTGVRLATGEQAPSTQRLDAAVARLSAETDPYAGGFGQAPKFPPSMVLEFLLRHHARTGDPETLRIVDTTCERMARGGIYDQLGGGFARYSVDHAWVVPHFEKMLSDNALLLRVYAHWWRATRAPTAERVVRETAGFLLRELRTAEGGFASSLDADSPPNEGAAPAEGAFYAWTPAQLRSVLGEEDGAWAAQLLRVTEEGTFEHGASTLQLPDEPDDPDGAGRWRRIRDELYAAREQRPRPGRDDKVVAAWNGLAVAALAEAGALFAEPGWIEAASRCADLIEQTHVDERGRLRRVSRDGVAGDSPGVLEDYADVAEGMLALVSVTGNASRLAAAQRLLDVVLTEFRDPDSGFFDTGADETDPRLGGLRRPQDPTDNAVPSGWSAAAGALVTAAAYTGNSEYRAAAEEALRMYDALAARAPRFAGWGLAVAEAVVAGPVEVAVVGEPADARTATLHAAAMRHPSPGAVVVASGPEPDGEDAAIPLLRGRGPLDGAPAAYVCRGFVCDRPTSDADEMISQMSAAAPG